MNHATRIALRAARLDDCERVWQWNFAPEVRAVSKTNHSVTLADHVRWYSDRIATPNDARMWIVEDGGRPVGVVRLDRIAKGERVSIALASDARGHGVGHRAIELACRRATNVVFAEILITNLASCKCFESCGFVATEMRGDVVTYRWTPYTGS